MVLLVGLQKPPERERRTSSSAGCMKIPLWKLDCCRLGNRPSASRQAETSRSRWSLLERGSLFPSIPNPAQTALVRLKLATAAAGCSFEQAGGLTVGEAVAIAQESGTAPSDEDLRVACRRAPPSVAGGGIGGCAPAYPGPLGAALAGAVRAEQIPQTDLGRGTWSLLPWGVRITVRPALRCHLPPNWSNISRHRIQPRPCPRSNCSRPPLLHRLFSRSPRLSTQAFATSWPSAPRERPAREAVCSNRTSPTAMTPPSPVDIVTASNIFDTEPPAALTAFLESIAPAVSAGGVVVVRSLFHETSYWPQPPTGWNLDQSATETALDRDQAPLCRISAVFRKA